MSIEDRFNKYLFGIMPGVNQYLFDDKPRCNAQHTSYMLNRTQSMFKWDGLPETIPQRVLELYLQTNGNVCFAEVNGSLYVFTGALGGEPDVYYMPTIYTVANPALKFSKTLTIDSDCIVISNDAMYIGLLPLFTRYASMLTETELSIKIATINSRIIDLISASDDVTKESALKYLTDIESGKQGVIAERAFLDGVRTQPYGSSANTNTITNLIELEQYEKASWFNELGLNANYNMKRESINADESQLNNDALLPLVDDMLHQRELGAEKVNKMFGTNITVSLASSWEDNQIEVNLEQKDLENDPKPNEPKGKEGDQDDNNE